jgi:hypothetical protein
MRLNRHDVSKRRNAGSMKYNVLPLTIQTHNSGSDSSDNT